MKLAKITLDRIETAIAADGGAAFRQLMAKIIPHNHDAFRGNEPPFRPHLGASVIGGECVRSTWLSYRWAVVPKFPPRMLRLFNRGHLEESRLIALLEMIGVSVYQNDANGRQYRITHAFGHMGGSGDGIGMGVPDIPEGEACLLEFKTVNDKGYQDMIANGCEFSKPVYFVQIQTYLEKFKLRYCLFMMVNKNDDSIHAEIIEYRPGYGNQFLDLGQTLVFMPKPPKRPWPGASPGYHKCKYCDRNRVCFGLEKPDRNCRTCAHSAPVADEEIAGRWICNFHKCDIPLEMAYNGCDNYTQADWT